MTPEQRHRTFLKYLPRMLSEHPGEFALVREGEVEIFRTREEALKAGNLKYGLPSDFLIRRIEPSSPSNN